MKSIFACVAMLLLTSVSAWSAPKPSCNPPACPNASQPAGSSLLQAQQLVRLHGSLQLSKNQLETAASSGAMLLERQALRALDPDNRLNSRQLGILSNRVSADIRPQVRQAFLAMTPATLTNSLTASYQQQLSASERDHLLQYYHSPHGQHYLAFIQALDNILSTGLAQLSQKPFSFSRSEQADSKMKQQRHALLAMSSLARQIQAARSAAHQGSTASIGLAIDLLAIQAGPQLDRLALRYASELSGFVSFQQSPAAQSEVRAQWQWEADSAARWAPLLERARQQLQTKQPAWQQLAATLLHATTASGAE